MKRFGPKNCQFKLKFSTSDSFDYPEFNGYAHFSVFDWKYLFRANLVQKIKIVSLSCNLVPRLIRISRIQQCGSHFLFLTGNTIFGQKRKKIVSLSRNLVPRVIQYLMYWIQRWFHFFSIQPKVLLLVISPKNQNCQFELQFGTLTNWNMQNLTRVFTFCSRPEIPIACRQIWSKKSKLLA